MLLNAPAVFRFTAPADPGRHLEAARLMGADVVGARPEDAGEILARSIIALMRRVGMLGSWEFDGDRVLERHRARIRPR